MRARVFVGWSVGVVVLGTALVVAPGVWASEGSLVRGSDDQRSSDEASPEDLLRGPEAAEVDVPGVGGMFAPGMEGRRGGGDPREQRWLQRIVRSLAGDDADASVRLTGAQREVMREAMSSYEAEVRAYREAHAQELRELREIAGVDGRSRPEAPQGARGRVQSDRPEPTPEQARARQRMREINRGTPSPEAAIGAVWGTLTEAQRAHVEKEMEALREADRDDAASGGMMAGMDARRAGGGTPDADDRVARLMERLNALPEADRARLLARLEQFLDRYERGAQESRRRQRAPRMEDADVRVPGQGAGDGDRRRPDRRRRDADGGA